MEQQPAYSPLPTPEQRPAYTPVEQKADISKENEWLLSQQRDLVEKYNVLFDEYNTLLDKLKEVGGIINKIDDYVRENNQMSQNIEAEYQPSVQPSAELPVENVAQAEATTVNLAVDAELIRKEGTGNAVPIMNEYYTGKDGVVYGSAQAANDSYKVS